MFQGLFSGLSGLLPGDPQDETAALRAQFAAEQARAGKAEAERDRLREALEKIADFAPGNGDVCEVIARIARAALSSPEPRDE